MSQFYPVRLLKEFINNPVAPYVVGATLVGMGLILMLTNNTTAGVVSGGVLFTAGILFIALRACAHYRSRQIREAIEAAKPANQTVDL